MISNSSSSTTLPVDVTENSSLLGKSDAEPSGTFADGVDDEERQQEEGEDREGQFEGMPEVRKKLRFIVPAISIGLLLAAADQTIIVSSYGKIGSDLRALEKTSWIATSYFLTLTSFQPLYGRLSDIFGRKAALLFGYAIFGIGCLWCGLARDMDELIAARAFSGIGGGGVTTVVSIMFSDIIPLRERGVWQGLINIIYAAGAGLGAPLGGWLADTIGWRWAFLGQAPLCLLAFVAVAAFLHLPTREKTNWRTQLRRVDFLGALTLVLAVFALILALDRGANDSWMAPIAYVPLILCIPLFGLFIYVEMYVASEPFAPGHIIFSRSLFACYLCNFFSFGGWMATLFYLPLYFQAVDGFTSTQAGVRLLPGIIAGVCGSLFGGVVMKRTGKYYGLTIAAYTSLVAGMATILLFTGLLANSTWGISIGFILAGVGNGIGVTTSLIALIANANPADQAVATACSYLFRSLGSVVGVSLAATVVQQSLRTALQGKLSSGNDADEITEGVRRSLDFLGTLEPGVRAVVRGCYAGAVQNGFGLLVGIVGFAMVSAWFIKEKRLSR